MNSDASRSASATSAGRIDQCAELAWDRAVAPRVEVREMLARVGAGAGPDRPRTQTPFGNATRAMRGASRRISYRMSPPVTGGGDVDAASRCRLARNGAPRVRSETRRAALPQRSSNAAGQRRADGGAGTDAEFAAGVEAGARIDVDAQMRRAARRRDAPTDCICRSTCWHRCAGSVRGEQRTVQQRVARSERVSRRETVALRRSSRRRSDSSIAQRHAPVRPQARAPVRRPAPRIRRLTTSLAGRARDDPHAESATIARGSAEAHRHDLADTPGLAPAQRARVRTAPGSQTAFTCGPASIVKNTRSPAARNSRTRAMQATVAAVQYDKRRPRRQHHRVHGEAVRFRDGAEAIEVAGRDGGPRVDEIGRGGLGPTGVERG